MTKLALRPWGLGLGRPILIMCKTLPLAIGPPFLHLDRKEREKIDPTQHCLVPVCQARMETKALAAENLPEPTPGVQCTVAFSCSSSFPFDFFRFSPSSLVQL